MQQRPLTLIEVLQPQSFKATAERMRATRTIVQPDIDALEQKEALATRSKAAAANRPVTPAQLQGA